MSVVSLLNVDVRNNPAPFQSPYQFEITFECLESLQKDLEWKLTYVGSATSPEYDQELDALLVGPVPVGVNKFVFEAEPPNLGRIPNSEIIGVTVILLTCSYDSREFVRVGYYVSNEYTDEALALEPPPKPVMEKVQRNILSEKPRVTRFAIKWDSEESAPAEFPPDQPDVDEAEDDGALYGIAEAQAEAALIARMKAQEQGKLIDTDNADAGSDANGNRVIGRVLGHGFDKSSGATADGLDRGAGTATATNGVANTISATSAAKLKKTGDPSGKASGKSAGSGVKMSGADNEGDVEVDVDDEDDDDEDDEDEDDDDDDEAEVDEDDDDEAVDESGEKEDDAQSEDLEAESVGDEEELDEEELEAELAELEEEVDEDVDMAGANGTGGSVHTGAPTSVNPHPEAQDVMMVS